MSRYFSLFLTLSISLPLWAQANCQISDCNFELELISSSSSNSIWVDPAQSQALYSKPYTISLFSEANGEDSERLWSQTKIMYGFGLGVMGVIALLPADVSKWESSDETYLEKWWHNVSSGPVWDRDQHWLNFIGHPYFGGGYYHVARKSGYRQWDSFLYSAFMSTFFWEYGLESFAEVPSVQDLIITPVGGWLIGEWMYETEIAIRLDGSRVFGSQSLGTISLIALDPIDAIGGGVNSLFGTELLSAGTGYITVTDRLTADNSDYEQFLELKLNYKLSLDHKNQNIRYVRGGDQKPHIDSDPVDSGIIGISAGVGYTALDSGWQLTDEPLSSFSVGLYFNPSWSASLSYSKAKLEHIDSFEQVNWENYNINAQYYLNSDSDFRPFITAGLGETLWQKEAEGKYFQLHSGLGLYYKLASKWALQTDWRAFYSTRFDTVDQSLTASLIYRFNGGER